MHIAKCLLFSNIIFLICSKRVRGPPEEEIQKKRAEARKVLQYTSLAMCKLFRIYMHAMVFEALHVSLKAFSCCCTASSLTLFSCSISV